MKMKPVLKAKYKQFKTQRHHNDDEQQLQEKYGTISVATKLFAEFPLSPKTLRGLSEAKYINATDIQRLSLGPALQGRDVVATAVTGSGKTLAFLIPVLEHLYIQKWSRSDGIGAIIISPTRELAYQIFETLKKVGKHHHDLSAGLIIGGKNLKFERRRMDQCNILICTPGRLLQHMDENPLFNASTMKILVLDEADRCLDMGFEHTLNAIVENFPPQRQTLLFSATQTNSLKDLARLNLTNPVYVGPTLKGHEETTGALSIATTVVPDLLQQNYVVIPLEDKITMLWSFVKNHLKQKVIVFLSSCKQVKYIYEIFCKLRPGTSLLALYGTLHQDRRIAIYQEFVRKCNVVLFATDIASRGLDFPSVNWVVQLDCPEDVTQYIHRAGRSARNMTRGESLLVLTPSEEEVMVKELCRKEITVRKIQIDPKRLFSPRNKIESFLAANSELKSSAQRAFVAYVKSVFLMRNKRIFRLEQLDLEAYARSLGLVVTPRVRFFERYLKNQRQGLVRDAEDESNAEVEKAVIIKKQKPTEEVPISFNFNFTTVSDSDASSANSDDDFIKIKRRDHEIQDDNTEKLPLPVPRKGKKLVTKTALAKKAIKKKLQVNEKRLFDQEGNEIVDNRKELQSTLAKLYEETVVDSGIDIAAAKQLLYEEDKFDKQRFRELVKQRHKQLKVKLKQRADVTGAVTEDNDRSAVEAGNSVSDDGKPVDLNWLPHPNRICIKKKSALMANENRSQSESEEGQSNDDESVEPPASKMLKMTTSKLSLSDAEVIAAQLLVNSV